MRAWDHLRAPPDEFDIVQDNQCLGYGLLAHRAAAGPARPRHDPPPDHRGPPPRDGGRRDLVQAAHAAPLVRLRRHADAGRPPPASGIITVSENSFKDIVADHKVRPRPHGRRARRRRPRPVQAAARRSTRIPGRLDHHRLGRRRHEGPQVTCSRRWPSCAPSATTSTSSSSASRKPGGASDAHHRAARPRRTHVEFVTRGRATSASSSSTPRPRWPSCRRSTRASRCRPSRPWRAARRWSPPPAGPCPRSIGKDGDTAMVVPPGRQRGAGRQDPLGPRRSPTSRARIGARGRQRIIDRWSWKHTALQDRRAVPASGSGQD